MQPIPITPAPVEAGAGATFATVGLVAAGVFAVAALVLFFLNRGKESRDRHFFTHLATIAAGFFAMVGFMGAATVGPAKSMGEIQATIDAAKVQNAAVQSTVLKSYGLKLNTEEAGALEYPEKAPRKDFKIYGQLQKVGKGSQLSVSSDSVYLIWTNGSLQLAEGSGQDFTEIQSKA